MSITALEATYSELIDELYDNEQTYGENSSQAKEIRQKMDEIVSAMEEFIPSDLPDLKVVEICADCQQPTGDVRWVSQKELEFLESFNQVRQENGQYFATGVCNKCRSESW